MNVIRGHFGFSLLLSTSISVPLGLSSDENIQAAIRARKNQNHVFEAERCGKLFQMKAFCAAIDFVKFSSKSELSSRFFGRLKFSAVFSGQAGRGPVNG